MLVKMRSGTLPPQFTDHTVTPTWVDDVAQVFDYCIQNKPTGIYHMVGSSAHTDFEMAQLANKVFDLGAEIKPGLLARYLEQVKRPYQKTMMVSNQKLTKDFGIKMKTFEEGLNEVQKQISGN